MLRKIQSKIRFGIGLVFMLAAMVFISIGCVLGAVASWLGDFKDPMELF